MASLEHIDVQSLVSKYLRRQTVNNPLDEAADASVEVQALLESVALSFILFPQLALSMVLRAKNTFQQVVQTDLNIIDFMIGCVRDVSNPDGVVTDVSDLVDAQTALIELDQVGRVSADVPAYARYQASVKRFLDQQLARSLKRHQRNEFERSGTEARQDLFSIIPSFVATHQVLVTRLAQLAGAVSDFESLDLASVVSTKTLTRVRSSLRQLQAAVELGAVSNTVVALELLAGVSALTSIARARTPVDPTVSTELLLPDGRTITASSSGNQAFAVSSAGPFTLVGTPANFALTVNPLAGGGTPHTLELPATGVSGKAYVTSFGGSPTFAIPGGSKLYVRVNGFAVAVTLTSGVSVPFATLVTDINTGLVASGGHCLEFYAGSNRFLIWAATEIVIRDSGNGTVDGFGIYTPPADSAHTILGFLPSQQSLPATQFTAESLRDALAGRVPEATFLAEGPSLRVTSNLQEPTSSLLFGGVAITAGFPASTVEAQPVGLALLENGVALDPASLNVFIGSVVSISEDPVLGARNMTAPVVGIDASGLLLFDEILPRVTKMSIRILAPIVVAVQDLVRRISSQVGTLERDTFNLQKVLSPVFAQATQAQTNDALAALTTIRAKLSNNSSGLLDIISSISVRDDRTEFSGLARDIVDGLTERGLDRAVSILSSAQFSTFFAVGKDAASHGARFLLSMGDVARNDLPQSIIEQDIDDGNSSLGSNPNTDVLPGKEPSA